MTDLAPGTRMAEWLEQAWMERYLARQLSGAESDWFEAYLLDKDSLLEELEADTLIRDGLNAMGADASGAGLAPAANEAPHPSVAREAIARRRLGPSQPWWLAAAAGVVVAALVGWNGHRWSEAGKLPGTLQASPTRIVFNQTRGGAPAPHIENPSSDAPYVVVDVAIPLGADNVTVRLGDAPPTPLAVSGDGYATFLLERARVAKVPSAVLTYRLQNRSEELALDLAEANASK